MTYTKGPWNIHPSYRNWQLKAYYEAKGCNNDVPWVAADVPVGRGEKIVCVVKLSTAQVGFPGVQKKEEFVSNINLIVTAPELLEALDNLVSAIELPGEHCEVEQAVITAKAVIDKAINEEKKEEGEYGDERGQE